MGLRNLFSRQQPRQDIDNDIQPSAGVITSPESGSTSRGAVAAVLLAAAAISGCSAAPVEAEGIPGTASSASAGSTQGVDTAPAGSTTKTQTASADIESPDKKVHLIVVDVKSAKPPAVDSVLGAARKDIVADLLKPDSAGVKTIGSTLKQATHDRVNFAVDAVSSPGSLQLGDASCIPMTEAGQQIIRDQVRASLSKDPNTLNVAVLSGQGGAFCETSNGEVEGYAETDGTVPFTVISESGVVKYSYGEIKNNLAKNVTHELGHLLGLRDATRGTCEIVLKLMGCRIEPQPLDPASPMAWDQQGANAFTAVEMAMMNLLKGDELSVASASGTYTLGEMDGSTGPVVLRIDPPRGSVNGRQRPIFLSWTNGKLSVHFEEDATELSLRESNLKAPRYTVNVLNVPPKGTIYKNGFIEVSTTGVNGGAPTIPIQVKLLD